MKKLEIDEMRKRFDNHEHLTLSDISLLFSEINCLIDEKAEIQRQLEYVGNFAREKMDETTFKQWSLLIK